MDDGKNLDATGAFGPWLVTSDAVLPGAQGLRIQGRLNGRVMQDARTDQLIFSVSALIEMISVAISLEPGDVIITGTPGGVGRCASHLFSCSQVMSSKRSRGWVS
jgi:acylpyruvate hydrolase